MKIEIVSRSQFRKDFVGTIAQLYACELGLWRSKASIVVHTVPGLLKTTNMRGACMLMDDGTINIGLDSRLDVETMCIVLAHEMVHAKQYALGQLKVRGKSWYWMGRRVKVDYYDTPWELEAFGKERILANKIAKICRV